MTSDVSSNGPFSGSIWSMMFSHTSIGSRGLLWGYHYTRRKYHLFRLYLGVEWQNLLNDDWIFHLSNDLARHRQGRWRILEDLRMVDQGTEWGIRRRVTSYLVTTVHIWMNRVTNTYTRVQQSGYVLESRSSSCTAIYTAQPSRRSISHNP